MIIFMSKVQVIEKEQYSTTIHFPRFWNFEYFFSAVSVWVHDIFRILADWKFLETPKVRSCCLLLFNYINISAECKARMK